MADVAIPQMLVDEETLLRDRSNQRLNIQESDTYSPYSNRPRGTECCCWRASSATTSSPIEVLIESVAAVTPISAGGMKKILLLSL